MSYNEVRDNLKDVVDRAKWRGDITFILRRGQVDAAIVPVEVAREALRLRENTTEENS